MKGTNQQKFSSLKSALFQVFGTQVTPLTLFLAKGIHILPATQQTNQTEEEKLREGGKYTKVRGGIEVYTKNHKSLLSSRSEKKLPCPISKFSTRAFMMPLAIYQGRVALLMHSDFSKADTVLLSVMTVFQFSADSAFLHPWGLTTPSTLPRHITWCPWVF